MARQLKKPTQAQKIILVAVMIVAVAVVILSGKGTVSKQLVEAQLSYMAERIAERAKENGADASFTYEGVEIRGLPFREKAIIVNPTLSYRRLTPFRKDMIAITTPHAVMVSDRLMPSKISILFPEPFAVTENGAPAAAVRFDGVPAYSYALGRYSAEERIEHMLALPPAFTVTQSAGKEIQVSYQSDPVASVRILKDGQRQSELDFSDIRIAVPAEGREINIASLASTVKRGAAAADAQRFDMMVRLNDIGIKDAGGESGPYSVKLSAEGTESAREGMQANIRETIFAGDTYNVAASGMLTRQPEDPLPFGQLTVKVNHFPALQQSPLVPENYRPLLGNIAAAITGQPLEGLENAEFIVKREKLGSLKIGEVTFEQLVAYVVPQLLTNTPAPPKPASEGQESPPADAPAEPAPEAPESDAPRLSLPPQSL